MRTLRLALLALAIAVSALSASPALCAEAPEVINNKKTVLHKNFFDIPVALVPKMGYNFEKIDGGVVDKKQKVSLEGTLLHMPYSRLIDEISHDALKKGGMEVKSRYSFIWNGSRAELMKIFAGGRGGTIGKWVLIVDRGADKCWMISGSYNSKDMRSAQFVLDMIRSAWWENGEEEGSGWPLYGGIDPKGTPFRLAGFRQDALIYTKDGKIPTQSADQALFVVSSAAREYVAPEKRAELALTEIRKVERGASLEIISQTDETIGGAPAVVIAAKTEGRGAGADLPGGALPRAARHDARRHSARRDRTRTWRILPEARLDIRGKPRGEKFRSGGIAETRRSLGRIRIKSAPRA